MDTLEQGYCLEGIQIALKVEVIITILYSFTFIFIDFYHLPTLILVVINYLIKKMF